MAAVLSSVTDCCSPCSGTATVQVPGPPGDDGNDGDNGTNGVNAFTTLTAGFSMPAEGATVVASVADSSWAAINQLVYVQNAGWMRVTALPSSTQMTLRNEEDTATGAYSENVAPTTAVANGSKVSPGGLQGPAGTAGTGGMDTDAGNAVLPDARTNLGLLTAATFNEGTTNGQIPSVDDAGGLTSGEAVFATANGLESQAAATARTSLGLAIGTNVQAFDAFLTDIATLGTAADRYIYTDGVDSAVEGTITAAGRAILDDASATAQRSTLGVNRTTQDTLIYQHQLAAGTDAGDFTSGSWQTVPLNTEVTDTGSHGSIAANTVTLAQGTYRVRWRVCGYLVDRFQSRLFNVTTAGVVGLGSNAKSAATDTSMAYSEGEARITIAAATENIRIEAQCETTNAGDGFGIANGFGGTQVYAALWLEKEAG